MLKASWDVWRRRMKDIISNLPSEHKIQSSPSVTSITISFSIFGGLVSKDHHFRSLQPRILILIPIFKDYVLISMLSKDPVYGFLKGQWSFLFSSGAFYVLVGTFFNTVYINITPMSKLFISNKIPVSCISQPHLQSQSCVCDGKPIQYFPPLDVQSVGGGHGTASQHLFIFFIFVVFW